MYNDICMPNGIRKIQINNETCNAYNSDILAESYCEYPFHCSLVSYQCYNNQSRIENCSNINGFFNGRLIVNVTALLERYQEEFKIFAFTVMPNQTSCTFEIVIRIHGNNDPITPTATRMASSIGSSTSAQMSTSPSGASSLIATAGVSYAITTLLLFLVSLFCSY